MEKQRLWASRTWPSCAGDQLTDAPGAERSRQARSEEAGHGQRPGVGHGPEGWESEKGGGWWGPWEDIGQEAEVGRCSKVGMEPFLCSIPKREEGVGMFRALGLIRDENLKGLESDSLWGDRKSLRKHSLL